MFDALETYVLCSKLSQHNQLVTNSCWYFTHNWCECIILYYINIPSKDIYASSCCLHDFHEQQHVLVAASTVM